jgi:Bacterial fructose-1,6-bisphosphatase, glpX-encoded
MADESPVIESKTWSSRSNRSTGHSADQQSAPSVSVEPQLLLGRLLTLEIVRVAERAAVAAARLRGRGNERKARGAAADAMRRDPASTTVRCCEACDLAKTSSPCKPS